MDQQACFGSAYYNGGSQYYVVCQWGLCASGGKLFGLEAVLSNFGFVRVVSRPLAAQAVVYSHEHVDHAWGEYFAHRNPLVGGDMEAGILEFYPRLDFKTWFLCGDLCAMGNLG